MIEDKHLEFTSSYRLSDDLITLLDEGRRVAEAHPVEVAHINRLINGLPGCSPDVQQATIRAIGWLLAELDRLDAG